MLRITRLGLVSAALLALSACGGHSAPTMPNGSKVAVMVALDRSVAPEMPADKAAQYQQVREWMEPDLVELFQSRGYDSGAVTSVDTAPGRYLLRVKLVNYDGGSKAARMFVGWGAGAARLDASFELIG